MTRISKGDVVVLQTSDLDLFWHDSCRYRVWTGVRVGQKVPSCVCGECDFYANWLHVSYEYDLRTGDWMLIDDIDLDRRLTWNIHIGVCVGVALDTVSNIGVMECQASCSSHTTCENCTQSACMWCSSGPPHCVESNSYVASFPYGQCREWTTLTSKCPGSVFNCHG